MNSGIYEILNLKNGKRYIGSAVSFHRRWYGHRRFLRLGEHPNAHLQSTWIKHGESAFVFQKVLICDRQNLLTYEQIAIDALKPEYNKCPTAGSTLGRKFSDATRQKMSVLKSAENLSAETRARMSDGQRRRRHTPETKAKLSAHFRGRIVSEETCAKLSASLKGHPVSDETREKMRIKSTGRKHSPETVAKCKAASPKGWKHTAEARAKISAAKIGNKSNLGRRVSQETIEKIRAAHTGKVFSEEHRKKISDARIGRKFGPQTPEHVQKRAASAAETRAKKKGESS